jgi:3-(3-hydroxy-phenyl)propionate hydroxylase
MMVQPRVRVRDGAPQRLDDALGDGFAVVAREHAEKTVGPQVQQWLRRIGARWLAADELEDLDGWLDELLARHLALVVRPDRYIFGAADDAPGLEQLLASLQRGLG